MPGITNKLWIIFLALTSLALVSGCADPPVQSHSKPTFEYLYDVNSAASRPASSVAGGQSRETKYPQWLPPLAVEGSRQWQGIIIHHSASDYGDAQTFDGWHRQKGWDELGYHFVIDNGISPLARRNGEVEIGSRWLKQKHGAHCRVDVNDDNHWNEHYIGICLVGNFEINRPTEAQYNSLKQLIEFLTHRYNIPHSKIIGHKDADSATLCPGRYFSWNRIGINR